MKAIYVHIPYCIKKCRYCDFCSVALNESAKDYCVALKTELSLRRSSLPPDEKIETIFFGGGTPTILPSEQIADVLRHICQIYNVDAAAEISIECNPKTASYGDLATLKNAGFNRLSVGLQSEDDALLNIIGRAHNFSDFLDTIRWARQTGFSNINVDVMHGLPTQTQQQYLDTLKIVCDLDVEHISAYSLILEDGTELKKMIKSKQLSLPDEDVTADMQDAGLSYLKQRGYERYEVSNFAKQDSQCRHNLTYWNNKPYLGFGVAAHSSVPDGHIWVRYSNTESIPAYFRLLNKGRLPTAETLRINKAEQIFETVMLGLRKVDGIDKNAFIERFGIDIEDYYHDAIRIVGECGWWDESATHLRLNEKGMDMLNSVLVHFR